MYGVTNQRRVPDVFQVVAGFTPMATRLAVRATIVFTAAAAAGALLTVRDWEASAPLLVFHALLLINTYFSIRCFASIAQRPTVAQTVTDGALVALYITLAFQFGDATRFLWVSVVLFLVATIKYVLMLGIPGYAALLTRKMVLDLLGAAACGLALAGVTAGLPQSLEWWLGVFLLAHIYILLVSRIYFPVADHAPSH